VLGIKEENMKNLLPGVYKTESLVSFLLQLCDRYELEDLHTCQSQDNIEGLSGGDSLVSFLQTGCEEQR
jgi:hypothetical protein